MKDVNNFLRMVGVGEGIVESVTRVLEAVTPQDKEIVKAINKAGDNGNDRMTVAKLLKGKAKEVVLSMTDDDFMNYLLRGDLEDMIFASEKGCKTPGKGIRSKGKGRKLATGDGKGPIGVPYKNEVRFGSTFVVRQKFQSELNELTSKGIPLPNAIAELERQYDAMVIVQPSGQVVFVEAVEDLDEGSTEQINKFVKNAGYDPKSKKGKKLFAKFQKHIGKYSKKSE